MRRIKGALAILATAALVGGLGGCVDSEPEEARTPADAPTVVNTAPQTDSEGMTITAPGDPGGAETGGETDTGGADPAVAAGMEVFAGSGTCQGCHNELGQEAGVGPQLAGAGRDEEYIRDRVVNGVPGTAMPAGLVMGEDLDNVVAFVLSIQ